MTLFDTTTYKCSELITKYYSTSFSLGIRTLHPRFHASIYAIYGFVRYADEIVDTFHDHDKKKLLDRFEADTFTAIEEGISLNPVLHSFQDTVRRYHIDHKLIHAFLYSMRMDLNPLQYTDELYHTYIYGSAEVVGLMCLWVFCQGDKTVYDELESAARALGSAFQKVNFLRDMRSDYEERGRVYFPGVDYLLFDQAAKEAIEADIQKDFDQALKGIMHLPKGAKEGVLLAYQYYQKLFDKIKRSSTKRVTTERIRIPDSRKITILTGTWVRAKLGMI